MLEGPLSALLVRHLSHFIQNVNEEQIRVSLWSGDLVLRDVELRHDILDQIALLLLQQPEQRTSEGGVDGASDATSCNTSDPTEAAAQGLLRPFTVVRGVVRTLSITVPWSALDREPVSVEMRGVEIVLGPLRARPFRAEEEEQRVRVVKKKMLGWFEQQRELEANERSRNASAAAVDEQSGAHEAVASRSWFWFDRGHGGFRRPSTKPFSRSSGGGADRGTHDGRNFQVAQSAAPSVASMSYMERLFETVARNAHVTLRDVSVQYLFDYDGLHPDLATALTVYATNLCISTTDEDWQDRFVVDLVMSYRRMVTLEGLRVVVQSRKIVEGAVVRWAAETNLLESSGTIEVRLQLPNKFARKNADFLGVHLTCNEEVVFHVSPEAATACHLLGVSLQQGHRCAKYRELLHMLAEPGSGGAAEGLCRGRLIAHRRWRYAVACIVADLRKTRSMGKNRHGNVDVVAFGHLRREYIALFKRSRGVSWLPKLTASEEKRLEEIEAQLHLEQIIFIRCLAYAELEMEQCSTALQLVYIQRAQLLQQGQVKRLQKGGLWSWLGSGSVWRGSAANLSKPPTDASVSPSGTDTSDIRERARADPLASGGATVASTPPPHSSTPLSGENGKRESTEEEVALVVRTALDFFYPKWAAGMRYLQLTSVKPLASQAINRAAKATVAVVVVDIDNLVFRVLPDAPPSAQVAAFPACLKQTLSARVSKIHFTWFSKPVDDCLSLCLTVASLNAGFEGPLVMPLIQSKQRAPKAPSLHASQSQQLDASCGSSTSTESHRVSEESRPWLSLLVNSTGTRARVTILGTTVTMAPMQEWAWWAAALSHVWKKSESPTAPTGLPLSMAHTSTASMELGVHVGNTTVRVPYLLRPTVANPPSKAVAPECSSDPLDAGLVLDVPLMRVFTTSGSTKRSRNPAPEFKVVIEREGNNVIHLSHRSPHDLAETPVPLFFCSKIDALKNAEELCLNFSSTVDVTVEPAVLAHVNDAFFQDPLRACGSDPVLDELLASVFPTYIDPAVPCHPRKWELVSADEIVVWVDESGAQTQCSGGGKRCFPIPPGHTRVYTAALFHVYQLLAEPLNSPCAPQILPENAHRYHGSETHCNVAKPVDRGVQLGGEETASAKPPESAAAPQHLDANLARGSQAELLAAQAGLHTGQNEANSPLSHMPLAGSPVAASRADSSALRTGGSGPARQGYPKRISVGVAPTVIHIKSEDGGSLATVDIRRAGDSEDDDNAAIQPYTPEFVIFGGEPPATKFVYHYDPTGADKMISLTLGDVTVSTSSGLCLLSVEEAYSSVVIGARHADPSAPTSPRLQLCEGHTRSLAAKSRNLAANAPQLAVSVEFYVSRLALNIAPQMGELAEVLSGLTASTVAKASALQRRVLACRRARSFDGARFDQGRRPAAELWVRVGVSHVDLKVSRTSPASGDVASFLGASLRRVLVQVKSASGAPSEPSTELIVGFAVESLYWSKEGPSSGLGEELQDEYMVLSSSCGLSSGTVKPLSVELRISMFDTPQPVFDSAGATVTAGAEGMHEQPVADLESKVSVVASISGGKLFVYHEFITRVIGYASDPIVARFLAVRARRASQIGYSSEDLMSEVASPPSVGDEEPSTALDGVPPAKKKITLFQVIGTDVEVFFAADARCEVDTETPSTFVLLHGGQWSVRNAVVRREDAAWHMETVVAVQQISTLGDGVRSKLTPIAANLTVRVLREALLIPNEEGDRYSYLKGTHPGDSTILVSLDPAPQRAAASTAGCSETARFDSVAGEERLPDESAYHVRPPGAALDVTLCPAQLDSLLRYLRCNLMNASAGASGKQEDTRDAPPAASQVVLLSIPSIRVVLTTESHRIFSLRVRNSLQFYRAAEGQWTQSPVQNFMLCDVTLDEIYPSERSWPPTTSRNTSAADDNSSSCHPLARIRRFGVTSLGKRNSVHQWLPLETTFHCLVDGFWLEPNAEPFLALRDMLLSEQSTAASAPAAGPACTLPVLKKPQMNPLKGAGSSRSHVFVQIRNVNLHFTEPCGEHLGTLSIPSVKAVVHNYGAGELDLDVAVDEPFQVYHCLASTGLEELLRWDSEEAGDAEAGKDETELQVEPLLRLQVAVAQRSCDVEDTGTLAVDPWRGTSGGPLDSDPPLRRQIFLRRPEILTSVTAHIQLRDAVFVVLPAPLLRLAANIGAHVAPLFSIARPAANKKLAAVTVPLKSPAVQLTLRSIKVVLPFSDATSHDQKGTWTLQLGLASVRNEVVPIAPSIASGSAVPEMQHTKLHGYAIVFHAMISNISLRADSLYPLHIPDFAVRMEQPIHSAAYFEKQLRATVSNDNQAKFVSHFAFLTKQELCELAVFRKTVEIETREQVKVHVSFAHLRKLLVALRTLHVTPSSVAHEPSTSDASNVVREELGLSAALPKIAIGLSKNSDGSVLPDSALPCVTELRILDSTHIFFNRAPGVPHPPCNSGPGREEGADERSPVTECSVARWTLRVAVNGAFEVVDSRGTVVLFRQCGTGANVGSVQPVAGVPRAEPTDDAPSPNAGHAVRWSGSQQAQLRDVGVLIHVDGNSNENVASVTINGVYVALRPTTVNYVLTMHNVIRSAMAENLFTNPARDLPEGGDVGTSISMGEVPSPEPRARKQAGLSIQTNVQRLFVLVDDVAVVEMRNLKVAVTPRQAIAEPQMPYAFAIDEIRLVRHEAADVVFASASAVAVSIGVGNVAVSVGRFHVNNYDSHFFVCLGNRVQALKQYIVANVKLSKESEHGFRQSILISLSDVSLSLHRLQTESVKAVSHLSQKSASSTAPRLTIAFPTVVVKQTGTTTLREFSVETENGSIWYRQPSKLRQLPPFVNKVSFSVHVSNHLVERSQSVTVQLGKVMCAIPVGPVLQDCVEAVAQSILPFIRGASRGSSTVRTQFTEVQRSQSLVIRAPLLLLHVCGDHGGDASAAGSEWEGESLEPRVLFGVEAHELWFESKQEGPDQVVECRVMAIDSVVDPSIQSGLVKCSGPSDAADPLQQAAIFLRQESRAGPPRTSPAVPFTQSARSLEASGGVIPPRTPSPHPKAPEPVVEAEPTELEGTPLTVSCVGRIHPLQLTISPALLGMVNENVLAPLSVGVARTLACAAQASDRYPGSGLSPGSADEAEWQDRVLRITSDYYVKSDIRLGGLDGPRLLFAKMPLASGPQNRITVKGVNQARIFVSMWERADGQLEYPIVIESGLTVTFENVRFVLPQGRSVSELTALGDRSLLLIPNQLAVPSAQPSPMGSSEGASGPAAVVSASRPSPPHEALEGESSTSRLTAPKTRYYVVRATVDFSAQVELRLWSRHQTLALSAEAYAQYSMSKKCFEGRTAVMEFLDERGEIALANLVIFSDSGTITTSPTGLLLKVKHHKPREEPAAAGITSVYAIVPPTMLTVSRGHLKLLYDTAEELKRGSSHLEFSASKGPRGLASEAATLAKPGRTEAANLARAGEGSVSVSSDFLGASAIAETASTVNAPPATSAIALIASAEGEPVPHIQFNMTVPNVELLVTNEFFMPRLSVVVSDASLQVEGNRSISSLTIRACGGLRVADFPDQKVSRSLLCMSPEATIEFARYSGGGKSVQAQVSCPDVVVTLPLATALRAAEFDFSTQQTGAFAFKNSTGLPLVLVAAAPSDPAAGVGIERALEATESRTGDGRSGGRVSRAAAGRPTTCLLAPGAVEKPDIFHYNQPSFRIMWGSDAVLRGVNSGSFDELGVTVDLSKIQSASECRFALQDASTGYMDVVLRLNELERIVDITSSVSITNELARQSVSLPSGDASTFVVAPGETRWVPLPSLKSPLHLGVGDEWRTSGSNTLITLGTLISAFTLATSLTDNGDAEIVLQGDAEGFSPSNGAPMHALSRSSSTVVDSVGTEDTGGSSLWRSLRAGGGTGPVQDTATSPILRKSRMHRNELQIPVILEATPGATDVPSSESCSKQTVVVTLTRRRKATNGEAFNGFQQLLPKFEVSIVVGPLLRVINRTGVAMHLLLTSSEDALASLEAGWSGITERHATSPEDGPDPTLQDAALVAADEEYNWMCPPREEFSGPYMLMAFSVAGRVLLAAREALELAFDAEATTIPLFDAKGEGALFIVERLSRNTFIVKSAALIVNNLPVPLEVYSEGNALLVGQSCSASGIEPKGVLPVGMPMSAKMGAAATVPREGWPTYVRVRLSQTSATLSQPFVCNAATLSSMLHSQVGEKLYIFKAHRITGTAPATGGSKSTALECCPVVSFEPMWSILNTHNHLPLYVRCVGSDENAMVVPPCARADLSQFHASSAADPLVQVRYGDAGLFQWSMPIPLITLSSTNVATCLKHYLDATTTWDGHRMRENGVVSFANAKKRDTSTSGHAEFEAAPTATSAGRRLSSSSSFPTSGVERFACLAISPSRTNGHFYVAFNLDEAAVPIVIENRTPRPIEFAQTAIPSASYYVVSPYSDCGSCWEAFVQEKMQVTLIIVDTDGRKRVCVVDLLKAEAGNAAIEVTKHVLVLCTYDALTKRHYISVSEDRALESTRLQQPKSIVHLEAFVHNLSLYVASLCASPEETSLHNTSLRSLSVAKRLRIAKDLSDSASEEEVIQLLSRVEVDVFLVRAKGLYAAASTSGPHIVGRFDLGRAAIVDCTTPFPKYPIVLLLDSQPKMTGEGANENSPALTVQFHMVQPKGVQSDRGVKQIQVGDPASMYVVESLRVTVAPIVVKLCDAFLFSLTVAWNCAAASTRQRRGFAAGAKSHGQSCGVPTGKPNLAPRGEPLPRVCYIARLYVSRIDLELTLSRRADNRLNPFRSFPIGSLMIPSVERAPLSIRETVRADIHQRCSTPLDALMAVLWPSYRTQLVFQFYKVIGSLEALGNPVMFVTGLSKGIRSLVVETAYLNPMQGARLFLSSTTSSTLHSVGLLSHIGSRTAAAMSFDQQWLDQLEGRSNDRAGIIRKMASGFAEGLGGVVTQPYRGARHGGVVGFFTGMASGAIGLVTRPVAGILDGVGNTAEYYSLILAGQGELPDAHDEYLASQRNFVPEEPASGPPSALTQGVDVSHRSSSGHLATSPMESSSFTGVGALSPSTHSERGESPADDAPQPPTQLPAKLRRLVIAERRFVSSLCFRGVCEQRAAGLQDREAVSSVLREIGGHNLALHVSWHRFHALTTPEDFFTWAQVALERELALQLQALLSPRDGSSGRWGALSTYSSASARKRARNIKSSLGVRDMLKYVTVDECTQVCTLEEMKRALNPEELQSTIALALVPTAAAQWQALLFPSSFQTTGPIPAAAPPAEEALRHA